MHIAVMLAIISNILLIVVLSVALIYGFEQPKFKAAYGYVLAGSMLAYLLLSGFVSVYGLLANRNPYALVLLLCMISPFVIGRFVSYETLKKYTVVQIMCFVVSLTALFLKF